MHSFNHEIMYCLIHFPATHRSIHASIYLFMYSFVHFMSLHFVSFIHSCFHSFIHSFVINSFIRSFQYLSLHFMSIISLRCFIHSFHSFLLPFKKVHSLQTSLLSLIHWFVHSCMHSFNYLRVFRFAVFVFWLSYVLSLRFMSFQAFIHPGQSFTHSLLPTSLTVTHSFISFVPVVSLVLFMWQVTWVHVFIGPRIQSVFLCLSTWYYVFHSLIHACIQSVVPVIPFAPALVLHSVPFLSSPFNAVQYRSFHITPVEPFHLLH